MENLTKSKPDTFTDTYIVNGRGRVQVQKIKDTLLNLNASVSDVRAHKRYRLLKIITP